MKRLLLPLLALLIPAAHATDYVECEAIRAVIYRNRVQRQKEYKRLNAEIPKISDEQRYSKYKVYYCELLEDPKIKAECQNMKEPIVDLSKKLKPYDDIEKRATNDFKKRGCYYF